MGKTQKTGNKMKRDVSLDAVCGILIIYVIVGHACQWCHVDTNEYIADVNKALPFFMPWFYFKSGMFYHQRTIKETTKQGFKKFIIPYFAYLSIGEAFNLTKILMEHGEIWGALYIAIKKILFTGASMGNLPLWFLPSLFLVKVCVCTFEKYNVSLILLFTIAFLIAGMGNLANGHLKIPYLILNTSGGVVFFLLGYKMKKCQYHKIDIIFSTLIYLLIVFLCPSSVDFRSGETIAGFWFLYIVSSVAGIILVNNLFRLKIFQIPYIVSIGKHSLNYYCAHWVLFNATFVFFNINDKESNYHNLMILLASCIIILPTYSYWLDLMKRTISTMKF